VFAVGPALAAEPQAVRPLMSLGDLSGPSRLPRRVFLAFVGGTLVVIAATVAYSISTGWVPPRSFAGAYSGIVLPLYFAMFLAVMTLSFVVSGNTLMHHYRTGTVQRATDPTWFWSIVVAQAVIAVALAIVGFRNWKTLHG
jgi:hypothetical protein